MSAYDDDFGAYLTPAQLAKKFNDHSIAELIDEYEKHP